MGLSLTADSSDLAVLVPTPSVPTVSQGESATFDRLAILTTPPPDAGDGGGGDGNGAGAPQAAPSVVSRTVLQDVVATVIKGGTPAGVTRWLSRHGYAQKPQLRPVIADYLRDGWAFTAVKLRADRPFDGQTDPIVLTFASDRLVYPMRLSSLAAEVGTVTVYTLDRHFDRRVDAGAATAPGAAAPATYRTLTPRTYADGPLHTLAAAGNTRLTELVFAGLDPATLTSDFAFAADPRAHAESGDDSGNDNSASAAPSGTGSTPDSVPPWLVGVLAFVGVLALGGIGLGLNLRRRAGR